MVTTTTLLQTIYDELVTVCSSATSVDDVDAHVGVLNRTKDAPFPFFGFEWTRQPNARGLGGNVRAVADLQTTYNSEEYGDGGYGDAVDGVRKARDYVMTVDVGAVTDGDDSRTRDEFLQAVNDRFARYIDKPHELHDDVDSVTDGGASPDQLGMNVATGLRQTYVIEYATYMDEDVPTAVEVDVDIDAGPSDAYPEQY